MIQACNTAKNTPGNEVIMESDLGEMVFAAEKISKKRLRKGKGKPLIFCFEIDISSKDRDFDFLHFFCHIGNKNMK